MYQIWARILCVECRDDGIDGQSQPLPRLPLQTKEACWSHRCSQRQPTWNSKRKIERLLYLSLIWSYCSYSSFSFSCTCMSEYIHKWNQGDMHVYIYRSICIRFANNSQYTCIYLNILTGNTCMLYELWNFSAVILECYIILFSVNSINTLLPKCIYSEKLCNIHNYIFREKGKQH